MTYIRTHHKARVRDALLHALSAIDLAVEYMDDIVEYNQRHDAFPFHTLQLIDDVDLLNIYTRQIERIVKEL